MRQIRRHTSTPFPRIFLKNPARWAEPPGQARTRSPSQFPGHTAIGTKALGLLFLRRKVANWYNGPFRRQGHGQQPKSGNPAHRWHWLQKTDQGWESRPLVAGNAQHFETAQQAIHHAKSHGFEVYDDPPDFKDTFAIIP